MKRDLVITQLQISSLPPYFFGSSCVSRASVSWEVWQSFKPELSAC